MVEFIAIKISSMFKKHQLCVTGKARSETMLVRIHDVVGV